MAKFLRAVAVGLGSVLLAASMAPPAAHAEEANVSAGAVDLLAMVDSAAQDQAASAPLSAAEVIVPTTGEIALASKDVAVPDDPDQGIVISTADGPLTLSVPAEADLSNAETHDSSAVYQGNAMDVIVQATNGGVRVTTVVGEGGPLAQTYQLGLADGAKLVPTEDGGAEVVVSPMPGVEAVVAEVGQPWAVDADGEAVPTHYVISGDSLVQVLEPTSTTTYPIVADPALEGNCSWGSCTVYFNREWTRNARDAGWLLTVGVAVCALTGPGAVPCAVAWGLQTTSVAVFAGRYYEDGDCVKFKKYHWSVALIPERHKRGQRNCR